MYLALELVIESDLSEIRAICECFSLHNEFLQLDSSTSS